MKSTTGGQHSFAQVPQVSNPRSAFNRSCGIKTTFDAGFLIPIFVEEALPGDTMNLRMTHFARLATQVNPVMDNLFLDTFFFSVANRTLWENWEKFNGAQDDPGDTTAFEIPKKSVVIGPLDIGDYMGLPIASVSYNLLPERAYVKIWNEWFRDENLQDSLVEEKGDAAGVTYSHLPPFKRGKRHDYFTSSLPFPQKGPSVSLPLGTTAPIVTTGTSIDITGGGISNLPIQILGAGSNDLNIPSATSDGPASFGTTFDSLETDLSLATAATVNQLREAFQIQKLYERDARGGTRYTEILKAHFGVTSPDFRLQRAEYLGGGSSMISINPVSVTNTLDATNPGATQVAYGTSTGQHGFTKSFTEHCTIIGMVCLRADLNYQEGLERMWSRTTRWDYYWPALQGLGEQAILNQEILYQDVPGVGATDDQGVFGYIGRYDEYRFKPSIITGQFRSSHSTSLDIWHLAQDFNGVLPALDSDFIEENPPIDRVIATPAEPHMIFDGYFQFKHVRPMPTYGVPGMIDHF